MAHPARLPGPQAGSRPRPLRRPKLARLPPPRQPVDRRLWLPDLRAGDDSPLRSRFLQERPAGWPTRRLSTPRRRRSGPNGTSPTRSPPCEDASPSRSSDDCRDVPAAGKGAAHRRLPDKYDAVRVAQMGEGCALDGAVYPPSVSPLTLRRKSQRDRRPFSRQPPDSGHNSASQHSAAAETPPKCSPSTISPASSPRAPTRGGASYTASLLAKGPPQLRQEVRRGGGGAGDRRGRAGRGCGARRGRRRAVSPAGPAADRAA